MIFKYLIISWEQNGKTRTSKVMVVRGVQEAILFWAWSRFIRVSLIDTDNQMFCSNTTTYAWEEVEL